MRGNFSKEFHISSTEAFNSYGQWLSPEDAERITKSSDVTTPRGSTSSNPDAIELPKRPMTRAWAKRLQEAVSALFAQLWNDNEL